ncbi:MAG: hypothetical protein KTR28_06350 [Micavibrio sp.]|nr:hypothetical protein [Micavibrio sp.]
MSNQIHFGAATGVINTKASISTSTKAAHNTESAFSSGIKLNVMMALPPMSNIQQFKLKINKGA